MPQASEKLRNKMYKMFGSHTGDEGPSEYLSDHGYELTRDWQWKKEGVDEFWEMTSEELACLCFLVEEWDFGGLHETQS